VTSLLMGLPPDLGFRTKGQLAMDICASCYADGTGFDFIWQGDVLRPEGGLAIEVSFPKRLD
jgi:hypothetical protein